MENTGVGWPVAAVGLIAPSLLLLTAGRYGRGVWFRVVGLRLDPPAAA